MKRLFLGALQVLPAPAYASWLLVIGTMRVPAGPSINDKLAHALGFGLLAALVVPAVRFFAPQLGAVARAGWSFAAATMVGAGLELWQYFLPYRSAELLDLAADAVGALVGGLAASWVLTWCLLRALGRGVAHEAAAPASHRDH